MRISVVHFRASFFFFTSLYILFTEGRSNYIPSLPLADLSLQFFFCVFLFLCGAGGRVHPKYEEQRVNTIQLDSLWHAILTLLIAALLSDIYLPTDLYLLLILSTSLRDLACLSWLSCLIERRTTRG